MSTLVNRIWAALTRGHEPLAVLGLGFVGLHEAVAFARAGFNVIGYDIDVAKIQDLRMGKVAAGTVDPHDLRDALDSGRLRFTTDAADMRDIRAAVICVPTPVRAGGRPDLAAVRIASRTAAKVLTRPGLLVLTSTVPPGTTRDIVVSEATSIGLRTGQDVAVVYSAERVDPGNKRFPYRKIPRVLSGLDADSTALGRRLYRRVIARVHVAPTLEVAEMSKVLENCWRLVNISFMNEMALLAKERGIDIWEVVQAASTKPFGFMPHYPGAGVGGACIPWAPHYLLGQDGADNTESHMLRDALDRNAAMPEYIAKRVLELMAAEPKARGVVIIGVTYKPNVADTRESPGLRLINALQQRECAVDYHDPLVPQVTINDRVLVSATLTSEYLAHRVAVLVTAHSSIDYDSLVKHALRVFDTRNSLSRYQNEKIVRL